MSQYCSSDSQWPSSSQQAELWRSPPPTRRGELSSVSETFFIDDDEGSTGLDMDM